MLSSAFIKSIIPLALLWPQSIGGFTLDPNDIHDIPRSCMIFIVKIKLNRLCLVLKFA